MEYYTATKRNKFLVHANIWMNLIGIKLSEKSQKKILYNFVYMKFKNRQNESMFIKIRMVVTSVGRYRLQKCMKEAYVVPELFLILTLVEVHGCREK